MADALQFAILKKGVVVWNQWRQDNPSVNLFDLGEADLSGADLGEADLTVGETPRGGVKSGANSRT